MGEAFDERVFVVGEDEYRWDDVVLAAKAWGDWTALESDVRHILACIEHLREADEAPSEDEVDDAAGEFRYARDLESAEDMEAWLEARNVGVDDWMEHILGALSVQRCAEREIEPSAEVPDEEVERFLPIEAACGGALDALARKLAGRAAVAAGEGGVAPADTDRLARLDAVFEVFRRRVLTPHAIRDQVGARHLDWIRIRGRGLSFPSEAAAREAALCMKEDRLSLDEVAADAGQEVHDVIVYIEDIDAAFRDRFLSSRPLDVIGPVPLDPTFELVQVQEKILPSVDDDEIRERAEDVVLRRAVDREIGLRVRWLGRLA